MTKQYYCSCINFIFNKFVTIQKSLSNFVLNEIYPIEVITNEMNKLHLEYFTKLDNKIIKLGKVIDFDIIENQNSLCILSIIFNNKNFIYCTLINQFNIYINF
jgi:hypothetical protein